MQSSRDVPWLDADEMRAWRGLVEVFADVMASIEHDLIAEHGLSHGDYGVLANLSEAPEQRLRMCDLAARLHLSPSGLTRRLDRLVADGLVERMPSTEDRRVTLAVLTPVGFERLRTAAPDHVASVRRHLLDHLDRSGVLALAGAIEQVVAGREAADRPAA